MSDVLVSSIVAVVLSLICIGLLAVSDPKRHRQGKVRIKLNQRLRMAVTGIALLPAIALAGSGNFSALLVWMGMFTVLGLLVALTPPRLL